jgi:NAD(P)-dependent dehydrogenase (short-subunit alcohol dehydrogenase family)
LSVAASVLDAVEALTRALAVELAPLRVNAVCPGVVRSPLWNSLSDTEREELYRTVRTGLLTGRVGEVSDVARAYLYLITQPYATGSVLTLDGGGVLV